MVVAGFWSDPLYGGNQGMVGWELISFQRQLLGRRHRFRAHEVDGCKYTYTVTAEESWCNSKKKAEEYKMSSPINHPQTDVVVCGLRSHGRSNSCRTYHCRIQCCRNRKRAFLGLQNRLATRPKR